MQQNKAKQNKTWQNFKLHNKMAEMLGYGTENDTKSGLPLWFSVKVASQVMVSL